MTIISSGIYPINPSVTDGTQLAGYINELVAAINSQQASATRPPLITKGGIWTKTLTGDDIAIMVYDGSVDSEVAQVVDGKLIGIFTGDIEVNGITVGKGGGDVAQNTAVGFRCLDNNTTGDYNTAFGMASLDNNKTGALNTAIGYGALQSNDYGIKNVAIGMSALNATQYKDNSTAVGYNALSQSLQSGNVAVGSAALDEVILGSGNTAIGTGAGQKIELGSNNTLLGANAQPSASGVSNEVTIGDDNVTKTRLKGNVGIIDGLGVGNVDASAYDLYQSVFRVPNGQGIGITKDNTGHNAYIYFGSGTGADAQQVAIANKGGQLILQANTIDALIIGQSGNVNITNSLTVQGSPTSTGLSNVVMSDSGQIFKTTNTAYSKKEVDGLINAKNIIIDKLTERLDALELKSKATGSTKKEKK